MTAAPILDTALSAGSLPLATLLDGAELARHRGALIRFAQRRLHDPVLAEDVVHDVFEAVLSGHAVYSGRSAVRTWLTGVLKHKIVDLIRRRPLHEALDAGDAEGDGDGAAAQPACAQPGPLERAEQRQLLQRALAGIEALPAPLKAVMQLRVLESQDTGEVCRRLQISEANLFVRLHRARRQLLS